MKTMFATAERVSDQEIKEQNRLLNGIGHLKNILDATSIIFFIVNDKRQIVFSNQHFLEKFDINSVERILGLRPGESMGCINAKNEYSGCGTSEACRSCGMVGSIIEALEDDMKVVKETNVSLNGDKNVQLNLEVTASPFYHEGERFIYFSAVDIEQKKRKEMMENIFFHDVLNLMTSLEGYLTMMEGIKPKERSRYFSKVKHISNQLLEEIVSQQDLVKAENKKLEVHAKLLNTKKLLEDIQSKLMFVRDAAQKSIKLAEDSIDIKFVSDEGLLSRVLLNMLKNALEATVDGDEIILACIKEGDSIRFNVHNPGVIPDTLKHQIFQRSVSTKGTGRGLGTYSMKLLGEGYLQGKVWFTSSIDSQTDFYIQIPIMMQE